MVQQVGKINRNGRERRLARLSTKICNLYRRVLNSENRINNHAEAANKRLNKEMGVCNPIIWYFINNCLDTMMHFMSNLLLVKVLLKN